jgi:hypothetical protein
MAFFRYALLVITFFLHAFPTHADPAVVEDVTLQERSGSWTVSVTISHGDTGWDDYADGWRVETEDGAVLGTRVLHHPHVEEQPFTRSLSGVLLPDGIAQVMIRTSTNFDGWAAAPEGPYFLPDGP